MCSPWHLSSYEKPKCGQKIKSGIWFLWGWNLAYFTGGINSSTFSGLTRLTNRKGPVLPALAISTSHIKKKTFPSCPSKKVRLSQFILSLWVCTTGYFFYVWEMYLLSFFLTRFLWFKGQPLGAMLARRTRMRAVKTNVKWDREAGQRLGK